MYLREKKDAYRITMFILVKVLNPTVKQFQN